MLLFKALLNCATPKTTFLTFVQRKYPLRLLEGQVLSKTAYSVNKIKTISEIIFINEHSLALELI